MNRAVIHNHKLIAALLLLIGLILLTVFRFNELAEKTREGTTIGNIHQIRQAVLMYYQDHHGVFPRDLNINSPFGRYMESIPKVEKLHPQGGQLLPEGNEVTYGTSQPGGYGRGWYYNYENGRVFVNSTGLDSRGNSYTTY